MIFAQNGNLLGLTLVCPAFNSIISNSSMLLKKVMFKWARMRDSDRKYGSLDLEDVERRNWQQVYAFVKKHKRTLVNLKINSGCSVYELRPWQHFKLLSILSGRLKKLTTSEVCGKITIRRMKFPNLEELVWTGEGDLKLQGWKTPRLIKFSTNEKLALSGTKFIRFFKDQPQLKSIDINIVRSFEDCFGHERFPFRLTEFKMTGFHFERTLPFLESQRDSLQVLCLIGIFFNDNILRGILSLNLQEFELTVTEEFSARPTSLKSCTIRKLSFVCMMYSRPMNGIDRFVEACPNVEVLSIKGFRVTKELSKSIAANLKNLKTLNLIHAPFHFALFRMDRYSSLENFSANGIGIRSLRSFVEANPQLRLVRCENVDDDVDQTGTTMIEILTNVIGSFSYFVHMFQSFSSYQYKSLHFFHLYAPICICFFVATPKWFSLINWFMCLLFCSLLVVLDYLKS